MYSAGSVSPYISALLLYLNSLKLTRARESSPSSPRAFCLPADAALTLTSTESPSLCKSCFCKHPLSKWTSLPTLRQAFYDAGRNGDYWLEGHCPKGQCPQGHVLCGCAMSYSQTHSDIVE